MLKGFNVETTGVPKLRDKKVHLDLSPPYQDSLLSKVYLHLTAWGRLKAYGC